ncbi:hypothetical protein BVC71_02930 [Marivivens niveibacter]|uniref:Uncharacterized protein n=1 Tax=Marivivens niveibacter TaxID=1930667 RepID=A0A251X197_9RHOB|nr:ABC transporter permease [Marivivens niveibacter]OUD10467.1 hypothetical protein BVC71_02930 [Marivivens niveibacter]
MSTRETNEQVRSYLRSNCPSDLDAEARLIAFNELRDSAEDRGLISSPKDYQNRLAIEFAIAERQREISRENLSDDGPETVWELYDPNSPYFALNDGHPDTKTAPPKIAKNSRPKNWLLKIWSLWIQSTHRDGTMDRIGYLWLLADPMIHVLIICAIPFFLHSDTVDDMPVLPFGVIGACFLMTFRMAATGAMSGGGALLPQLDHPTVSRFDVIVARALHSLAVYTLIGIFLMSLIVLFGRGDLPANLPIVLLFLVLNWCIGLAYGTIFHALIGIYSGFRRINGFTIRFIALSSGTFYISEQLPDTLRQIVLMNPLLHSVQFARSYWFYEYKSSDASLFYLFFASLTLIATGLAMHMRNRSKVENVRA